MSEIKKVTLIGEDGQMEEFEVVDMIKLEGNKYALLAPVGNDEDAFVYKVLEREGREEYLPVEDDDEFERVLEEYESYFDEE